MKTALLTIVLALVASTCLAIQPPPLDSESQRAWLTGHLIADMKTLDTFSPADFGKVADVVTGMTDDQAALACQFYYLTRAKTEQDAYLFALQKEGKTDEEVNEAKASVTDLLTVTHDQSVACYDRLVTLGQPVEYLAQLCYVTVPGWCVSSRVWCPDWYYDNGYYVGGCYNSGYCGGWARPVYDAWYNHGSGFYSGYGAVSPSIYNDHSIRLAQRRANWYHGHNPNNHFRHDRLVTHSPQGRHPRPYDPKPSGGQHFKPGGGGRPAPAQHVAKPSGGQRGSGQHAVPQHVAKPSGGQRSGGQHAAPQRTAKPSGGQRSGGQHAAPQRTAKPSGGQHAAPQRTAKPSGGQHAAPQRTAKPSGGQRRK